MRDLGGFTITETNNFSFVISGSNGIVTNGQIKSGANGDKKTGIHSYALVLNNCDDATLDGLIVTGGISVGGSTGDTPDAAAATNVALRNCTVTSGDYYAVCAQQNATVTIESGTYTANMASPSAGVIQGTFVGTDGPKGTITVTGGTFDGPIQNNDEGDIIIQAAPSPLMSPPTLSRFRSGKRCRPVTHGDRSGCGC